MFISPPLRYAPHGEITPQFARPQCKMIILPDPCSKVRNSRSITAEHQPKHKAIQTQQPRKGTQPGSRAGSLRSSAKSLCPHSLSLCCHDLHFLLKDTSSSSNHILSPHSKNHCIEFHNLNFGALHMLTSIRPKEG